eukprot:TRINITY_DN15025_c0_g1_i1.p1 TRINITY_DN15025_c0_g1~~TRINITY_DN15025_c0_g1_i1.p1  ORF type:complete len:370 (+),score=47.20 TRINITY_DN15025_c0_g1_i1:155-1264(+)
MLRSLVGSEMCIRDRKASNTIDDYFGNLRRLSEITTDDVPPPHSLLNHDADQIHHLRHHQQISRRRNTPSISPLRQQHEEPTTTTRAQQAAKKALESLQHQHHSNTNSRSPLRHGSTRVSPSHSPNRSGGGSNRLQLTGKSLLSSTASPTIPKIGTKPTPRVPRGYTEKLLGLVLVNGRDFGPEAVDVNIAPSKALTKSYLQVGATIYNGPGYSVDVRPGDIIIGCEIVKFTSSKSSTDGGGGHNHSMLPSELLEVSCASVKSISSADDLDNTLGAAVFKNNLNKKKSEEEMLHNTDGLLDTSTGASKLLSYQFGRLHIHRPLWSNCGGIHGHSQSPSSSSSTAAQHLRVKTPTLESSPVAQALSLIHI